MDIWQVLRLIAIILAFVAMWTLWEARRKRKHLWTRKMRDIWVVQIGWSMVAAEGNIELFYRGGVRPTIAWWGALILLALSIKAARSESPYLTNQPE